MYVIIVNHFTSKYNKKLLFYFCRKKSKLMKTFKLRMNREYNII